MGWIDGTDVVVKRRAGHPSADNAPDGRYGVAREYLHFVKEMKGPKPRVVGGVLVRMKNSFMVSESFVEYVIDRMRRRL